MAKVSSLISLIMIAVVLQLTPAGDVHASGFWNCDSSKLTSFWEKDVGGNELSGKGTVCITPYGLWSSMKVRGLTAGNAYTTWWVYIDDPASCASFPLPSPEVVPFPEPEKFAGPCGLADFLHRIHLVSSLIRLPSSGGWTARSPDTIEGRISPGI